MTNAAQRPDMTRRTYFVLLAVFFILSVIASIALSTDMHEKCDHHQHGHG